MAASGLAPLPRGARCNLSHCVPTYLPMPVPRIPAPHVTVFCWVRSMSQGRGAVGFEGAFFRASPRVSWFPLTLLLPGVLWASLTLAGLDPRPLCANAVS